jgi:uncharacterized membrane protein
MSQFSVVVFSDVARAKKAEAALYELGEKDVDIFASAVIFRAADGNIQVLDLVRDHSHASLVASLIGAIVGAAAVGPLAGALGAASGALAGMVVDLSRHHTGQMLIKKVSTSLKAGNAAIIVDITFELVAPFEKRMNELGALYIWKNDEPT